MPAVHQIISDIRSRLIDYYPITETDAFVRILFRDYFDMSPADIRLHPDKELSSSDETRLYAAVDELRKYRPIQYIMGKTEFYGRTFKLTSDVLIPRPETEELTDMIVKEYTSASPKILDIGTGSGCIAVSLAVNLPDAEVWATDISESALAVANENAKINGATIRFTAGDILSNDTDNLFSEKYFDVIVSNPPYVALSEKRLMQPNVTEYEPHSALFPPGDDPLIFYKRIAAFGLKRLTDGGKLFFEINEAYPEETAAVLKSFGYSDIAIQKDINDKWRMIRAQKA